ncbi:MAG: alpha/beta fold hydrolase [Phycisphaerales bacterium]|nr:alpha/beta fold hydrolase [Hyphomonadaceae bacterium]
MKRKPDWDVEGAAWPNRTASRFVEAAGLRWHVQVMGEGPPLLLLHGTGAATHSWRALAPLLARSYTIVAPDLPGHGFTSPPRQRSDMALPSVARSVGALADALDIAPHAIVGHSAGAAIAVRMSLDGLAAPRAIVSINGALLPFGGPLGRWAPDLARVLFANPMTLSYFAHRAAQPGAIARLMHGTGSTLDAEGLDYYERLFRTLGHLEGTVGLMAHWDLYALKRDLPNLRTRMTLIAAERDRAVPVRAARDVARMLPGAGVVLAPGLGHLAHEEAPDLIAGYVLDALRNQA